MKRVIIIGGGIAGLAAALKVRRAAVQEQMKALSEQAKDLGETATKATTKAFKDR